MLTYSVSSISWLENDVFFMAHTPSSSDDGMIPETTYHLVTRQSQPQVSTVFQRVPDPCPPFGLHRCPAFQFMQRLRDFPPNLQDAIVVASTASIDIGLVTRSKVPLTHDAPSEKVTSVFTTTAMADDSRRAQLPMSKDQTDTSPIGVCFDLSSKDRVLRPLPREEFDASPGPLPALMILNNEGVLSSWWIVYSESIRQGTTYPGLATAGEPHIQQQPKPELQVSPFTTAGNQAAPVFGQSNFGKPSTPAASFSSASSNPATSTFASTNSSISGFGATNISRSPFSAPTVTSAAPQSGTSTFGQPSFGSSTPMGSVMGGNGRGAALTGGAAFGAAGGLGNRGSVWGTPSSGTAAASGSVFGQSGFGSANKSTFGAPSTDNAFGSKTSATAAAPSSGGFASFATKSNGFMTVAPSSNPESPFGKQAPGLSFGSGMDTDTSFGRTPKRDAEVTKNIFGGGGGAFTLGTTFKRDTSSAEDASKSDGNASKSMFGDGFGSALAATPQTKDADMDEEDDTTPAQNAPTAPDQKAATTTTQAAKPAPPIFQFPSVPPATGGLFGTQAQAKTTPAAVQSSQPSRSTFGKPTPITTTPKDTPQKSEQSTRPRVESSPKIKEEPHSDDDNISPLNEEEAAPPLGFGDPRTPTPTGTKTSMNPVPPESMSKTSFAPGDSPGSSKSSDEAPLPPDFLASKTKLKEVEPPALEQPALPEDEGEDDEQEANADAEGDEEEEGDLDDEGSGIDVAQEISPSTDPTQSPKITPGSSFGGPLDKSPVGGLFSRVSRPQDGQLGRHLFGEINNTSAPYFSPPSKTQESPRSPSPIRSMGNVDSLRPDNSRSASAPGPFKALTNRKNTLSQLAVPAKPQPSPEEIRKQERERMAAQQAKQAAEEEQDLSDREDERVREELETEVEGTKNLDPFLAHQDYIGAVDKPGIPGQIEKVYRDINSMIDTLGLNARSLTAFAKGHTELHKQTGRSREDLEDNDWCLIEIGSLDAIESDLEQKLEAGQIQDVQKKSHECRELRRAVASLRAKSSDVAKVVETRSNPEVAESARTAPLRLEQATQQYELRKQFMRFQKQLAEAEENITLLRAKLASCETSNANGRPLKKPTVEAVTNTIKKMTSIVEQKSGDIDLLETQMRHLRFPSAAPSQSSREGSPFTPLPSTTTTTPKRKLFPRAGASTLQNRQSPTPSKSATPRKSIQHIIITSDEMHRFKEKAQRRRQVNEVMKEAFSKTGPRIRSLD